MNSHILSWRLVRRSLMLLYYAMITQGFNPKKFDLVHQTVFLVRGVVWAQDYLLEYRNSTRAQPIFYME